MNFNYKKFFKYFYVLFALLFLIFAYGNAPLVVLTIGGVSGVIFIGAYFLIFRSKSEKKWINLLRFLGVIIASVVIFGCYFLYIFISSSACLDTPRYNLYQNIFTGEIRNRSVYCGEGPNPWYLKELQWEDPRNPNSSLQHGIKSLNL